MKTILFLASLCVLGTLRAQVYQNNTPVNVPDGSHITGDCGSSAAPGNASRLINVPLADTITDPSKVTFNINIAHTWLGDVVLELRTPAGNNCALIKRLGANGPDVCGTSANFVAGNTLSFAAGNTVGIPYQGIFGDIPAGVYAPTEGNDSTHYPTLIPLCNLNTFLQDVSVNGNWALVMYDNGVGDMGSIQSWQIVFAPGFGDPVSNLGTHPELLPDNGVSILGNPFTDRLTLLLNQAGTQTVLHVYAVDGKEMCQKTIPFPQAGSTVQLETGTWANGLYTLQVQTDGKMHRPIKLIKN